jgi:hypothetical protein
MREGRLLRLGSLYGVPLWVPTGWIGDRRGRALAVLTGPTQALMCLITTLKLLEEIKYLEIVNEPIDT